MVIEAGDSSPKPTLRKVHESVSYIFHSQYMQLSILIQFNSLLLDHPGGKGKGKGKGLPSHVMKAQRGSRVIAVLLLTPRR